MDYDNLTEGAYSYLEDADPEMLDLQGKIVDLEDKMKALIPADDQGIFLDYYLKQEELKNKLNHLSFIKVYKGGFKDGINFYRELP